MSKIEGIEDEDLQFKIEMEGGLDYFFDGYISLKHISDTELKKRVRKWLKAREEVVECLGFEA